MVRICEVCNRVSAIPGRETIREFEDRTLKADSLLRKLEDKPMCLYLDWLEDRLFAEFNYSCVDSCGLQPSARESSNKEGLIKARGGKHEKDDRPERYEARNTMCWLG